MQSLCKAMQIGSYFRHQHVQDVSADSSDLFAAFHLLLKRGQMPLNFQLQMLDGPIVRIKEHEQFSQEEAVVLSYLCAQSGYYLLLGRMDAWMHQLRQALRVAFSSTQRMQDGTS
jgi:hypothetical protein